MVVRRPLAASVAVVVTVLVTTAFSVSGEQSRHGVGPVATKSAPDTNGIAKRPERVVQLGDSIASGEGTLYGYTYDASTSEWTGGNVDVKWPGPHPDCHVSDDAYGNKVATFFHATFSQFACTGATFANGITAPETSGGKTLRPAEFGNWTTKQDLNDEYDKARPDLVLVTLGADDAQFVSIVENCIKNAYKYKSYLADEECISSNPGSTIQQDFFNFLPTLEKNYATLASWIAARANSKTIGGSPKVVFTTYPNPFPNPGVSCPDVSWLYPEQVTYLSSLVNQMNSAITTSIEGLHDKNVTVVDLNKAYQPGNQDHRWCTRDPWAYGLSIYSVYHPSSFKSQAPFHPTPQGQQAIADLLTPKILALFNQTPPPPSTTTTTLPTTTTLAPTTSTTSSPG